MSDQPREKGAYEHAGVVLNDGHEDRITGPRCMIKMSEGPYLGLYVIGHTQEILAKGTPVCRDYITGHARALGTPASEGEE